VAAAVFLVFALVLRNLSAGIYRYWAKTIRNELALPKNCGASEAPLHANGKPRGTTANPEQTEIGMQAENGKNEQEN